MLFARNYFVTVGDILWKDNPCLEVAADCRRCSAIALVRCRSAAATAVMRSSGLWNMRMSTCGRGYTRTHKVDR